MSPPGTAGRQLSSGHSCSSALKGWIACPWLGRRNRTGSESPRGSVQGEIWTPAPLGLLRPQTAEPWGPRLPPAWVTSRTSDQRSGEPVWISRGPEERRPGSPGSTKPFISTDCWRNGAWAELLRGAAPAGTLTASRTCARPVRARAWPLPCDCLGHFSPDRLWLGASTTHLVQHVCNKNQNRSQRGARSAGCPPHRPLQALDRCRELCPQPRGHSPHTLRKRALEIPGRFVLGKQTFSQRQRGHRYLGANKPVLETPSGSLLDGCLASGGERRRDGKLFAQFGV